MSGSGREPQDADPFATPQGEQAGSASPADTGSGGYGSGGYGSSAHGAGEYGSTGYGTGGYGTSGYGTGGYGPSPWSTDSGSTGYPAAPGGYPPPTGNQPAPYPPPGHPYPGYGPQVIVAPTNGLAIAALVTSILGLGIVAVICGHIARKQIRERGESGDGLAVAGLVIGYLTVAFWVLMILFFVFALVVGGAASGI